MVAKERKRSIRCATFKRFLEVNLKNYLEDIANHGADAGYPWLTYTRDTVALWDKYKDEIWELANNESESMGCTNVAEMIAGFHRADMLTSYDTFANLMVWFAAETYARQAIDEDEKED